MFRLRLLGVVSLLAAAAAAQGVPPPPKIMRPAPQAPAAPRTFAPLPAGPQLPFTVSHYNLKLTFNFPQHVLDVVATVAMTAQSEVSTAAFRLNQNLVVASVTDATGASLAPERQQDQVLVTFPAPLARGTNATLTFHYAGPLADARLSPINGIRTAYVGPDGAFLLYPGEWFPLVGYGTDRFTATISATLPSTMAMIASGDAATTPQPGGQVAYVYRQQQASFPGSVIVTPLKPQPFQNAGFTTNFYFNPDVPASLTAQYASHAAAIAAFLTDTFGTPPVNSLTFVELPADALPSFSSPGLIVLSSGSIGGSVDDNLLVDEIAQQWFGIMVSPATLDDAWLQYGAARFAESLYIQKTQGNAAWKSLITQLEVGALSYPNVALSHSSSLYVFSPQFQDLNYDKGALLFNMLRWQLGDQTFNNALRTLVNTYAWKPLSTAEFEQAVGQSASTDLRGFFSQWYTGTAVPKFANQYTVYRLGAGGYRVTGAIQQNLDLFNMPVQVSVFTDGATVTQTVAVSGSNSSFSIDTAGRPEKVVVDPNDWILKSSTGLMLRVDLSRGDNLVAASDFPDAIKQYQNALKLNPISSLAHYRLAEAYYQEQNWQNAADEYRQAMNGDLNPKWVVVWSHIQLGKIFDLTGQRNRAVNEYELALQTHDDTNGAQQIAEQYLKAPYKTGASAGSSQ
jgi:tetratricopeptide (TPR) repeat protein